MGAKCLHQETVWQIGNKLQKYNIRDYLNYFNHYLNLKDVYKNSSKGTPNSAVGSAVLGEPSNPSRPGKLIVNFDSQPSFARSTTTNYNVVDTDYNSYAIVYSCGEKVFGLIKSECLWILTRSARLQSLFQILLFYTKLMLFYEPLL